MIRILNEPTAASLAYGHGDGQRRTTMIYDLGGGTFDVSIVTTENDVTEVLASHGDTQLGGDDFDALLVGRLEGAFREKHGVDLSQAPPLARARLLEAAEEAKKKLSSERYVKVREEGLVVRDGVPLHLEVEVSRDEYEGLIRPLVERTLESVSRALADAGKRPAELDAILLVGGSTRTPLVARLLEERTGIVPRHEVHPDLCVALGAGVLASRLAGNAVERVLVDVSPYSFGISYLDARDGRPDPYCYRPILRRNTPLPVTRTESYFTAAPFQEEVEIKVFQGDDADALKNAFVGNFRIEKLTPQREPNEVLCKMVLDLDGILHVAATERKTGRSKEIRIENALRTRTKEEVEEAQARLLDLFAHRAADAEEPDEVGGLDDGAAWSPRFVDSVPLGPAPGAARIEPRATRPAPASAVASSGPSSGPSKLLETERVARSLLERSRRLLESMHADDREDTIDLNDRLESALATRDEAALAASSLGPGSK